MAPLAQRLDELDVRPVELSRRPACPARTVFDRCCRRCVRPLMWVSARAAASVLEPAPAKRQRSDRGPALPVRARRPAHEGRLEDVQKVLTAETGVASVESRLMFDTPVSPDARRRA